MNTNGQHARPLATFTDSQLSELLAIGQQAATLLYHSPITEDIADGWYALDTLTKQALAEVEHRSREALSPFDADATQEAEAVVIEDDGDSKLQELMDGITELRNAGAYEDAAGDVRYKLTPKGQRVAEFLEEREQRSLRKRLNDWFNGQ